MDGDIEKKAASKALTEAEAFRTTHPDVKDVDILLSDSCGIMRGKRLPIDSLGKAFGSGLTMPGSVFGMDITGDTVAASGLVWEGGDKDYPCTAIPGTLRPIPWSESPLAQLLLEMSGADGKPFFAAPRTVLRRQIEKLNAMGFYPVAASELEFYLVDPEWEVTGMLQPPRLPGRKGRHTTTQLYNLTVLDDFSDFLADVRASAELQGIPVDGALMEYAPGQFEINLRHGSDILAVADQSVLFKRLVQGVARKHDMDATFMAKPYPDLAGSGLHVHISLLDKDGRNVFADPKNPDDPAGGELLRHAIAGLAESMGEAMAIFAPGANSYRRFKAESYAPLTPTWGVNNRTTALRLPPSGPKDRRIEHRMAGADANPYLVIAAILAGIRHGIAGKLTPPPMVQGNAYAEAKAAEKSSTLPRNWAAALERFASSTFIRDSFGPEFQRVYAGVKLTEYEKFNAAVTPLELRWYLRHT